MPTVSIIIPCYNHGHYLGYTLRSVVAQTFTDWEAVVVDDGSTDDTAAVAASFGDPRIRYIYQANSGLAAARNAGIRLAQGEYLCFLDADDEWYPTFLSRCTDVLGKNRNLKIVGVYTSHVYIDHAGQVLPQPGSGIVPAEELPDCLIAGNFFPPHVVMVRTDVVREVGLFDAGLTSLEDKDLWFRVTRQYTLLGIPEPLAKYRVYPGSMSTNAARMYLNRMAVLRKHFGPEDGDPRQWAAEKRLAFSKGYQASGLEHIVQGDENAGWALLLRGAHISPEILSEVETYYELACIKQPRGYRGQVEGLDVRGVGAEILHMLEVHLLPADEPLRSLHGIAKGTACLTLAQLAVQGGNWRLARHCMWRAYVGCPRLLLSRNALRLAVKLLAGRRLWSALRAARRYRKLLGSVFD